MIIFFLLSLFSPTLHKYQIKGQAQGTTYQITYYAEDSVFTKLQADSIFQSLDNSLSLYKKESLINAFNHAKHSMAVDLHLEKVIRKSFRINKLTNGLFDITTKSLSDAWGFGVNQHRDPPSGHTIDSILSCTGIKLLKLKKGRLIKSKPCVQIDLNGIAQGYSVDVFADFLQKRSVTSYIIEIGGEIYSSGPKPGGEMMKVDIEVPSAEPLQPPTYVSIQLPKGALTTSGSYRKFYINNGKMITHLIQPSTGQATVGCMISVVVFAEDAMTADGIDNALMLMSLREGKDFISKYPKIAALFIYQDDDGNVKKFATSNFPMASTINSL